MSRKPGHRTPARRAGFLSLVAGTGAEVRLPVLPIGDGAGGTDICDPFKVVAVMAFPHDAAKQRQFVGRVVERTVGVTEGRAAAGQIPRLANLSPDTLGLLFGAILGQRLAPLGGFSAVSAAPGLDRLIEELTNTKWAGSVVGDMLHWIVKLHLHGYQGSVRKAKTIAMAYYKDATTTDGKNLGASKRYIEDNWSYFKPVAHLWAALRMWETAGEETSAPPSDWMSPFLVESLPTFLTYAHWYLRTATAIIPHGQKAPILSSEDVWTRPPDYPQDHAARIRSGPLPDWIVALAGKRRK